MTRPAANPAAWAARIRAGLTAAARPQPRTRYLCGCENPRRRHEDGCSLGLDRRYLERDPVAEQLARIATALEQQQQQRGGRP